MNERGRLSAIWRAGALLLLATICAESATAAPPIADAGSDETVFLGETVLLDGSGSYDLDPFDLIVSYAWSIESAPAGSTALISNPNAEATTIAPDLQGTYVFSLSVTDQTDSSGSDTVEISVVTNDPPIADAGPNTRALPGQTVQLAGSGVDPDGDPIVAWSWVMLSAPPFSTASLIGVDMPNPTFTPDVEGSYVFDLVVYDDLGAVSDPDVTEVFATTNQAPVADAGLDQSVNVDDPVQLVGNAIDPEGDPILALMWAIESAPESSSAELSNNSVFDPTFTPDLPGLYVLSLTASDPVGAGDPDTMEVEVVQPVPSLTRFGVPVLCCLLGLTGWRRLRS